MEDNSTSEERTEKRSILSKMQRWQKVVAIILLVLIIIILGIAITFFAMRMSGKNKLYSGADSSALNMDSFFETDETTSLIEGAGSSSETKSAKKDSSSKNKKESDEDTSDTGEEISESGGEENTQSSADDKASGYVYKEGDIQYNGHVYRYNSDILTFLILGIDSNYPVPSAGGDVDYLKGGQSDAMFLAVMNPHDKSFSVVAINRNAMVDIDIYDSSNNYVRTAKAQICVQHGYGDGRELSCERAKKAVSSLMYNLPIHGYLSMRLGAISVLNDAMGGVEVTLPTDFPELNMTAGTTVRLNGDQAFMFLKYRNQYQFDSATNRLNNDKVYLSAFMNQVFDQTKSDVTFPLKLYDLVKEYILTDISVDEMSYLASELLGYSIKEAKMYSIPGETVMGSKFEEFYVDEQALREQILNIFYEVVD